MVHALWLPVTRAVIDRLTTDDRVARMWSLFSMRKRSDGTFLHASVNGDQDDALIAVLEEAMYAAMNWGLPNQRIRPVRSSSPRAELDSRVKALRDMASWICWELGAASDAQHLCEIAARLEGMKDSVDAGVGKRVRGDAKVREVQQRISAAMLWEFGKPMHRTVAMLTSVITGKKVSIHPTRWAVSKKRKPPT